MAEQQHTGGSSGTTTDASGVKRSSPTVVLTVAVGLLAILVAAGHGIFHPTSNNGIFPIVLEMVQAVGRVVLGGTANKDESMFEYGEDGLPLCRKCHCTPAWDQDPSTFTCPKGTLPPWKYSLETIQALEAQEAKNPFELPCNPYQDNDCNTVPSLNRATNQSVCGLIFDDPSDTTTTTTTTDNVISSTCPLVNYTLRTFSSSAEASATRAVITHTGPCGVCSTTKDLAAYMRHPDMVAEGRRCTNRALLRFGWGVSCYESLGFTRPCAMIWAYNSLNSAAVCRPICVKHLFSPPNQPEPHCRLNECLHCDEVKSGPIFQRFGGRTRRNSGLRTPILRQCDGLANIEHRGCPLDVVSGAAA